MAKKHPHELLSHTTLVKRPRPVAAIIALLLIFLLVLFLVVPVFLAVGTGFVQDGRLSGYWLSRVPWHWFWRCRRPSSAPGTGIAARGCWGCFFLLR